jgi:GAF domain-containing protein
MTAMDSVGEVLQLRDAALQTVIDELRASYDVGRCTLRLEHPDELFPVVVESRASGVGSLIGDRTVDLRGQPVVEALASGAGQVVQDDSAAASDDPAFQRMLVAYGGLAAQIVTAVRPGGRLRGIISLHELRGPREWTAPEIALAVRAAGLVGAIIEASDR